MMHETSGERRRTMDVEVPPHLAELVNEWRDSGRPAQPGIQWPKERWVEAFPEQAENLRALPLTLDRAAVQAVGATAASDPAAAAAAFVAVLAWGYGRTGYGVWRAQRALSTPFAAERLFDAAIALRNEGPLAGYQQLAQASHRLPYFGPAFGTKFLALSAGAQASPPLILDKLVSVWLARNAGLQLNPVPWNVGTYGRYLEVMNAWAEALDVPADAIELCMFSDESRRVGNQWAPSA